MHPRWRAGADLGVFDPDAETPGSRRRAARAQAVLARAAFLEAKSVTDETSRVKITREDDDDDDDDERDGFVANDESSSERDARFDVAFGFIADALGIDATDPRPFELLGDAHAHERRFSEAEEAYTHAMACSGQRGKPPASLKLFLNLGGCLLKNGKFADARGVFAAACEMRPCASAWIGLGAAMLREGDAEGAEAALAEANVLDASNPNAWAYLAIVSLVAEPPRIDEAERATSAPFKARRRRRDARRVGRSVHEGGRLETRRSGRAARRQARRGRRDATVPRARVARARRRGRRRRRAQARARARRRPRRRRRRRRRRRDRRRRGGRAVPVPELLEELASVYDELGDARRAEECRRDLRALEREQ